MIKKRFHKTDENVQRITSTVSIKSLLYLLDTSDQDFILSSLLERKLELETVLKSKLTYEELIDILKAFVKVYNLKKSRRRTELLALTQSEEFINNIKIYLLDKKNISYFNHDEMINYIVQFVDVSICELSPDNLSYESFHSLLKILSGVQVNSKFCYISLWSHELSLLLQNRKLIRENRREIKWKNMSIFPTAIDIYEIKDLTPNRYNGAYKNVEEYLDITFKLLKEDFESSIREDLFQMKSELRGAGEIEYSNIFIHKNVNLEKIDIDRNPINGLIHRIVVSIDNEEKKRQMGLNKCFCNGSLLFFSVHSQFTTFILGSVIEEVKLKKSVNSCKILRIAVVGDPSQFKRGYQYTMIEPRNFYEPYFQVLKALQSLDVSNFPMEKYIIRSDVTPGFPPSYISIDTVYLIGGKHLKLFGKEPWPSNLLNLDFSQLEALRSALTHEFVLIRGAPGTGKTHLAEIIINILIENKRFLKAPILLISSKNNAVDRILEALFLKRRNVVRLGGQTKSTALKKCLLTNKIKTGSLRNKKIIIQSTKEALLHKIDQNAGDLHKEIKFLDDERNSYLELYGREAARQLLDAKVEIIGGTTTGCARMHVMLEQLQPEVVIVENANEVLESHVICALSKGCKHLILIGDREQLKPMISNKMSSDKYHLDISLFERMERCGIKACTLTQQYRMGPEIASLISPALYQKMQYHPEVLKSPKIKGMNKNLFFIDHEIAEDKVKEGEVSFSNKHEADMLVVLAVYLLKQGYSVNDITVLVPYNAQQIYMISVAEKYPLLHGLEIAVIDKYSGQENKIILLSLVRSQSANIGFLSTKNRIIVALSRARWGLYIIGNMKTLLQSSDFFVHLNSDLKKKQAIGKFIQLECPSHKTIMAVSKKEDFDSLKDFGCYKPCDFPLDCGHICKLKCHPNLENHKTFICREPCTRFCDRNLHKCKKKCFEECGPCNEILEIVLPCGHTSKKRCFDVDPLCTQPTVVSFLCCLKRVVPCNEAHFARV